MEGKNTIIYLQSHTFYHTMNRFHLFIIFLFIFFLMDGASNEFSIGLKEC